MRLKYEVERNLLVNECDVLNEELNILLSSAAALHTPQCTSYISNETQRLTLMIQLYIRQAAP